MNVSKMQLRDPENIHHATEYKASMPVYVDAISDAKLNRTGQQNRDIVFQDESLYNIQYTHPKPQQNYKYSNADLKILSIVCKQYAKEPTKGPIHAALLQLAIERGRTFYGLKTKAYNMGLI